MVFLNSKDTNSAVVSGTTATRIYLNLASQADQIWVGGMIVFTSGANKGLGANISATVNASTTLTYVDVSEQFAVIPEIGATYMLVRKSSNTYVSYGETIQLDKYIDSYTVTTSIDKGFDTASLVLNNRFTNIYFSLTGIVGMNVRIYDDEGCLFDGLVIDIESSGTINCIGYAQTMNWYMFEKVYDTNSGNTSPKILRDACLANPYIPNKLIGIDRSDTWHTAQVAMGGIGPRDYSETSVTAGDVIKEICSMGYFGISFDQVFLQIYEDAVPFTKVVSKTSEDVDYYIGRNNFNFDENAFALRASISDAFTEIASTYNSSDGETLYSPSAINLSMIKKVGKRRKMITTSNGSLAENTAIVRVANADFSTLMSANDFGIVGKVSRGMSNVRCSVSRIRAGDVVAIEAPVDMLGRNSLANFLKFTVGHTSYSSSDGKMTISPVEFATNSEIFSARIKI